jgi:hypothetical protein
MENLKLCNYCSSEIISKECMISHKAHMDAVEQSHKHTVNFVNYLVNTKVISNNDWNKLYTSKFNEVYALKINYLLYNYTNEYNKKNEDNIIDQ